jgi:serine phosphatase RsbU (regulator of sigma subunit)/CHASE3 domain sensor protein/anti-sigma regulatory factor (Ser/Thr protein kinase)
VLVSFVPLAFLLALLALALLLQDRIVQTAAWSQHSEEVITQVGAVEKALGAANTAAVQYSMKHDAVSVDAYNTARKHLPAEVSKLESLVAEDPAQLSRAHRLRGALNDGLTILDEYLGYYEHGQPARAKALENTTRMRRVSNELESAFTALTDAQRAKMIARFNVVRKQVQAFGLALILSSIAGILVALFVSARFGLKIAQRLRQLAENARLLAAGEPTQPIQGHDEIAALDGVYREMTKRIQREHHVASTLQRVLLPQEMPQIAGLRIDTAYVPAAKGAEVGGDWYDVFALSDRRICISVGDVGGHGLRAASIMGTARLAIRTAARIESEPANILRHVNRVLCSDEPNVVVTAFVATLDLCNGSLAYAVAGHPAPMHIRPGGKVEFLAGEGLLLGVEPRTRFKQYTERVDEGSGLVFYTDGIVEVERDYFKGLATFVDAVRAEYRQASDNIAEAIQRRVLARKQPVDDCALLFLGVTALGSASGAATSRTWTIDARVEASTRRLKRALLWHLSEVASPDSDLAAVELILGELVGNVARHSPGEAEITLAYDDGTASLQVCDSGKPFQPANGTPDLYAESGRGLFLVRTMSRDLKVERTQNGNRVSVLLPVSLH